MKNIGIVLALLVFVVLLFVVLGRRGPEKEGVKELKIEKIDKDAVTKIDITMPPPKVAGDAGPADAAAAKKVVLEKDGTAWKAYDPAAPAKKYTADDAQVKSALDAVAEFAPGDLVSNKKEKLADFEIDDAKGTTVKVATKTGTALDLVFGRPPKQGGGSTVRQAGSDDVYIAKGRLGAVLKKDLAAWRKKALFDLKPDDVTKVATTLADGKKLVVEATTPPAPPPAEVDGGPAPPPPKPEWKLVEPATLPAGFRLDTAQLARSASAVATLRAQDFADGATDEAAGLTGAHLIVEATGKDGKKVVLHVGKEDDKKRVYARVDGDPQMYLLAGYSAKQLGRTVDDLRDLTLLDAKIEDVERVTIRGSTGAVTVKKDGDAWKLVEPKNPPADFDATQVAGQVAGLLRSRATRVATDAPKDAMAKTGPTLEIALKGGKKQTLRFGTPLPVDAAGAPKDPKAEKPEPREYYAKGGVDDLVYVVAAFTRNRYDKPADIFKKPPTPPPGMGGMPGQIPGMENLPPDVRRKLQESLKRGELPQGHP